MYRRSRMPAAAVTFAASLALLAGLLVSDASAHGRRSRHLHRRPHSTHVVVRRPIVVQPRLSWAAYRPPPVWCRDASYVAFDGTPYWHHVGLGVYFGGVRVNVDLQSAPPAGCRYWDPYCDQWYDDARTYARHCDQCDHEPMLRIVHVDARGSAYDGSADGEPWEPGYDGEGIDRRW